MSILTTQNTDDLGSSAFPNIPLRSIEVEGLTAEVPCLLVDCFSYILSQGLVEGIFRVSGSIKRMRDVATDYAGYEIWLEKRNPSPHDVSGIIKKFTREYLQSIGGLFPQPLLASLRSLFVKHNRKGSVLSSESYRSVSTSYSSGLGSVAEEAYEIEYSANSSPNEKLDVIASLLVRKNSAPRNAFFIYYLSVLNRASAHQEQTRMPNANLAIVFQQYLLETCVVSELQSYQDLLEFLLDNFEQFVLKYRTTLELLAASRDIDAVAGFRNTVYPDSFSTSPLTEYSQHQASPPKFAAVSSFNGRRRSSLSQRFNSFWELYASPVNRSKRFSFVSRASAKSSTDRLPLSQDSTDQCKTSAEVNSNVHDLNVRELTSPSHDNLALVTTSSDLSSSKWVPQDTTRARARNSSQPKTIAPAQASGTVISLPEPPQGDLLLPLPSNYSDDVFPPDLETLPLPTKPKTKSLSRRLSLWFKGK